MTWEFLFFANLALLLRLGLLLTDTPARARAWWLKGAVEVALLSLLLQPGLGLAGAALVSVAAALAASRWDRRARDRSAVQLAIGVGQLLALSVFLGPMMGAEVRPAVLQMAELVRQVSAVGGPLARLGTMDGLTFLLGLLLVANEANLLLRLILGRLQLKPGGSQAAIDASEYARGRVIGLLERVLIYFFVLHGQFGAVGFTLAAKGFTRFKELDNRGFAEYVLIGTLLSSGLAMLTAVGIQRLL
jgi:hypothetical protein